MKTDIELEIIDSAHGGYGVGHADDGRVAFVRFALPGERVRARVRKERSKVIFAEAFEVLGDPHPWRVEHPWPEAGPGGVGGMDLGHVAFEHQAEWKTTVARQVLRRVGGSELVDHLAGQGIDLAIEAFASDLPQGGLHTRTRFDLVVDNHGRFAMHKDSSHELMPISQMPLAVREMEDLELFAGAWEATCRPGERVHVVLPSASDPCVVIEKAPYAYPTIPAEPFVYEDVIVGSALYTYRVHASGFWQIHREAPTHLIEAVMAGAQVAEGEAVVELYSGAGLFTQPLALATGAHGSVRAFEGSRLAVEDARANTREFGWVKVRTQKVTPDLIAYHPGEVVVADPPRAGLGVEAAQVLAAGPARRIVLVSCDLAALARDVRALVEAGRKVVSMKGLDMFPHTHHCEVVTTLV